MIDTKKLREALNGYFIPPLRDVTLELLDELDRVTAERDARKPLCWLQQDKFGNFHVADESWHGAFPVYGDQSEENKETKK